MLVLVEHLIRRGGIDRARATKLGRLLARFEAQPSRRQAPPHIRAQADRVARLKRELSEALGSVRACASCATGCVTPSGFFDGGRCCGTSTLEVFTQGEVRAIKLAGVSPPREPAPGGSDVAGCLFRGPTGCTVEAEARPARCLVYVCHDLRIELEQDAETESIASSDEMPARTSRFETIQRLRRELHEAAEALIRATG